MPKVKTHYLVGGPVPERDEDWGLLLGCKMPRVRGTDRVTGNPDGVDCAICIEYLNLAGLRTLGDA